MVNPYGCPRSLPEKRGKTNEKHSPGDSYLRRGPYFWLLWCNFSIALLLHTAPTPTLLHSVQSIKLENPTKKCRNLMKKFWGKERSPPRCLLACFFKMSIWIVECVFGLASNACLHSLNPIYWLHTVVWNWTFETIFKSYTHTILTTVSFNVGSVPNQIFFYSINKFWFSHLEAIAHKPQMVMVLGCNFIVC